jgi:glycosyltransferase involved in cell wall biosynthesis
MIYNDPIIVNQFLNAIKEVPKTFKLWVYLDQVYEGADMGLLRNIENTADRILCFTESWKAHLKTRLTTATLPIDVLEHGVDSMVFKQSSEGERMAIRKQLNLGMDAKVILNINRNSQRKRLDLSIMAFVRLIKKNPDLPLYMVFITSVKQEGGAYYNPLQIYLNELEKHGLEAPAYGTRLLTIDTTPPSTYYNDDTVNQLYNACDIGINTSNGEGFGLCQLEHLATGAPQVVLDLGGYRAFMNEDVAVFAPITGYEYMQQGAGVGLIEHTSTPELVCEALEKALAMVGPDTREKCIKVAKNRPWSKVCDAFLESIITTKSP